MANVWLYILITLGLVSFIFLVIFIALFWKLIWLQIRVWVLSKKGFHLVEHVGEDGVRRYYYMRPYKDHFDFKDGFYMFLPEATTKSSELLKKVDKGLAEDDFYDEEVMQNLTPKQTEEYKKHAKARYEEYVGFLNVFDKVRYDASAITLRFGIPTITYYGSHPDPINFRDRKKQFDAKILKDVYLRILLTQKFKEFQKWIRIAALALAAIAVLMILYAVFLSQSIGSVDVCLNTLNATQQKLTSCLAGGG